VKLLLDTHAVLWALAGSRQLSRSARAAIADPANDVFVSAVSAWEIVIKKALGRLSAPDDLAGAVAEAGFRERAISIVDAARLESLPEHHRDPFDRMLIAQALVDGVPIVTRDPQIARYPVKVLW
jgi:PIN domain nuclease of toxin-antitoxin system